MSEPTEPPIDRAARRRRWAERFKDEKFTEEELRFLRRNFGELKQTERTPDA